MIEPHHTGVRQLAASFAQATSSSLSVRDVEAFLVRRLDLRSRHISVEWLQRHGQGAVAWRYRQDRHALFLFEHGISECRGTMNGCPINAPLGGAARLAFVPAGTEIIATFHVPAGCSYLVAFLDASLFATGNQDLADLAVPVPQIGFAQPGLAQAFAQLRQELVQQDPMSRLMAEGWAIQAWALLQRGQTLSRIEAPKLPPGTLRTVLDHMRERMAEDLSVADLAALTGLGGRQFCRRFQATTGVTPARARDAMRLETAVHLLRTTRLKIIEIALDCGFSQSQHLATAIKRRYGKTPTELRL